jgi:8-oxo-dGTP pyrophosphatase MutT (NUDIX family)
MDSKEFTCAGIILVSGDYLLVVQGRNTLKWSFPKGHKEEGEDAITTAKREMKEETGVEIHADDKYCTMHNYTYNYDDNKKSIQLYFIYRTERDIKPIIGDKEELCDAKWVHIGSLADERYDTNRALSDYIKSQLRRRNTSQCQYGKTCRAKKCLYKH